MLRPVVAWICNPEGHQYSFLKARYDSGLKQNTTTKIQITYRFASNSLVSFFFVVEIQSCFIDETALQLKIFLFYPPECWDYMGVDHLAPARWMNF